MTEIADIRNQDPKDLPSEAPARRPSDPEGVGALAGPAQERRTGRKARASLVRTTINVTDEV